MSTNHATQWADTLTWGDRLVILRRKLGLTQKAAAMACGFDDATWGTWEKGTKPRHLPSIARTISDELDVPYEWLTSDLPDLTSTWDVESRRSEAQPVPAAA